jgi:hypothetical protein
MKNQHEQIDSHSVFSASNEKNRHDMVNQCDLRHTIFHCNRFRNRLACI